MPDQDDLARARDAGVPEIYFNGVQTYLTSSDIVAVLERNGQPATILNVSLPIAKALGKQWVAFAEEYERRTGAAVALPLSTRSADQT